jgi:hypothetical protein
MLKVTFDSNVWRIIATPGSFPSESGIESFRKINAASASGNMSGTLAETVFTLEAIKKVGRQNFLSTYRPEMESNAKGQPDGTIKFSFSIGPDRSAHPGSNHYLSKHWADAEKLGFKLLHCPRVAATVNPDLKDEWFINVTHDIANRFGSCAREIESGGCGISQLKEIGKKYAGAGQPWQKGLALSPDFEEAAIAKAVAEWADGDAVAAHYAYENDYVCTRDIGKSGGADSVFSPKNRAWLESKYGVKFITPENLAAMI